MNDIDWQRPINNGNWDISPLETDYSYLNDIVLVFHDGKHVFAKTQIEGHTLSQTMMNELILMQAYLFSNSKQELVKKAPWLPEALSNYQSKGIPTSNIEMSLTDSEGVSLQKEMIGKTSTGKLFIINGDYSENFTTPWSMIGLTGHGGGVAHLMIWENRSFLAFIAVEPEALAKTKKIIVKLVN